MQVCMCVCLCVCEYRGKVKIKRGSLTQKISSFVIFSSTSTHIVYLQPNYKPLYIRSTSSTVWYKNISVFLHLSDLASEIEIAS